MCIFEGETHLCTFCPLLDWGFLSEDVAQANPRDNSPMDGDEARSDTSEEKGAGCQENLLRFVCRYPYRKPTQVDWASSLR